MSRPILTAKFREAEFQFHVGPSTEAIVAEVFSDNYTIFEKELEFEPGDIIVDLGANEGIFSILMGKLYPKVKVCAYEPVVRTYEQLTDNIALNEAFNVFPVNKGVDGAICSKEIVVSRDHSGGSTSWCTFNPQDHVKVNAEMTTLDEIIRQVGRIKLLKIDIEGAEYDVLYNCTLLDKVDNIVAEFHSNARLRAISPQYDPHELATWLGDRTNLVYYDRCPMCE
jgi:FkbM family methyltransferase